MASEISSFYTKECWEKLKQWCRETFPIEKMIREALLEKHTEELIVGDEDPLYRKYVAEKRYKK